MAKGDNKAASQGFREFSQTGGYSPEDIANERARGVSPIRAAYSNAMMNINRQRGLQGGYSPNYSAVQSQMARQSGQGMSDAMQNVNASLAERIRQNRMNALQGLAGTAQHKGPWSTIGKIAGGAIGGAFGGTASATAGSNIGGGF